MDKFEDRLLDLKRGYKYFGFLNQWLPNPDTVLSNTGETLETYKELMYDPHVYGCWESRIAGVMSMEWDIDRGKAKSREAKKIKEIFLTYDRNAMIRQTLNTIIYGYQVFELVETVKDGFVYVQPVGIEPDYFLFDGDDRLLFRTAKNPMGDRISDKDMERIVILRHGGGYGNPYGDALLSRVYWWVTLKREAVRDWVNVLEIFGMPIGVGIYPDAWEKNETAKNNFLSNIGKLGKGSPSIRAESTKLEFAESNAPASADLYKMFIDYCDTMISMAILTQALTTDTGDKGSFAKTKVGWDMQGIIAENDKKYPEDLSKAIIDRLYKWNFTGQARATFVMFEESILNTEQAALDAVLIEKGIVKGFSKEYVMEKYNYGEDDIIMPDDVMKDDTAEVEITLQSLNLNGAQIASATKIVEQVSSGEIPRDSGVNQLQIFLGLNKQQAEAVIGKAGTGRTLRADKVLDAPKNTPAPQEFEESEDEIQTIIDADPKDLNEAMLETLKPLFDMMEDATSYDEALKKIAKLYPTLGTDRIDEILKRKLFTAKMYADFKGVK